MKPLYLISFFTVLFLVSVQCAAQSAAEVGLILKGDAKRCLTVDRENPELNCYDLRMKFLNGGNRPVIIINPTLGFGTGLRKVVFHCSYLVTDPKTRMTNRTTSENTVTIERVSSESETFKGMVPLIDGPRPAENFTVVVQPGDTFSFQDKFFAEPQFLYTEEGWGLVKDPATGKLRGGYMPVQKQRSGRTFTLFYEFSFLPYVSDPNFLAYLSQRWRPYGLLPVGTNGTYEITARGFVDTY